MPESNAAIAKQDLADTPSNRNPHFINALSLLMPEFIDSGWNIDDIAAYVNDWLDF
jgi:hypothetical protein